VQGMNGVLSLDEQRGGGDPARDKHALAAVSAWMCEEREDEQQNRWNQAAVIVMVVWR
jgi:hypothetical protein